MRINIRKSFKQYSLLVLGIILTAFIGVFIYQNYTEFETLKHKPTEVIVANISTKTATVYWKSESLNNSTIYYKKETDSGLYSQAEALHIYYDSYTSQYVYYADLSDLEVNSTYVFQIDTDGTRWRNSSYTFSTFNFADVVKIPNIITGSADTESFVLINSNNRNYMVDTLYHGTWAVDLESANYTISNYAHYKTKNELKSQLKDLLVSPVFAARGANCGTGIKMYSIDAKLQTNSYSVFDGWIAACPNGSYIHECYPDIYCRSLKAGVEPAFALAIWLHESAGSNYGAYPVTYDFGIQSIPDTVSANDFSAQADWFLNNIAGTGATYISSCKGGGSNVEKWGARFWQGNCTSDASIAKGKEYMTDVGVGYTALTNKDIFSSWPFTRGKVSTLCSSATGVNNLVEACDGTTSVGDDNGGGGDNGGDNGGGDDGGGYIPPERVILTVDGEDMYCTSAYGCICKYKSGEASFNVDSGYTCPATYTGKGVITNKICCRSSDNVSIQWPYDCKGTIVDTTNLACASQETTIKLNEGVNFIQAYDIVNSSEVSITSAKSLISYTKNKVIAVGLFRNDQWEKLVKVENNTIKGQDFNLEPGESYLVITTEPISITATVFPSGSSLNISKLTGWNLVPATTFKSSSLSSKGILQNTNYQYITQTAVWNTKLGSFQYTIRDNSGTVYGNSVSIPSTTSFFVRVSK